MRFISTIFATLYLVVSEKCASLGRKLRLFINVKDYRSALQSIEISSILIYELPWPSFC